MARAVDNLITVIPLLTYYCRTHFYRKQFLTITIHSEDLFGNTYHTLTTPSLSFMPLLHQPSRQPLPYSCSPPQPPKCIGPYSRLASYRHVSPPIDFNKGEGDKHINTGPWGGGVQSVMLYYLSSIRISRLLLEGFKKRGSDSLLMMTHLVLAPL